MALVESLVFFHNLILQNSQNRGGHVSHLLFLERRRKKMQ